MANVLQTPDRTLLAHIMDMIDNKQLHKIRQCLKNPDYDVNEALQDGETPLMRAVSCASQSEADDVYLQFLRSLVRHPQIDINFQTKKKRTALHVACGKTRVPGVFPVEVQRHDAGQVAEVVHCHRVVVSHEADIGSAELAGCLQQ